PDIQDATALRIESELTASLRAVEQLELLTVNPIVIDHRFNSFRSKARLESLTFGKNHAAGSQGAQNLLFAVRIVEEDIHVASQNSEGKGKFQLLSHEHHAVRIRVSPTGQDHVKVFAADDRLNGLGEQPPIEST